MTTLLELLRDGYFPKELPPPFTTVSFANLIASNVASLPSSFRSRRDPALTSEHNIVRVGILRRKLGIPNPITQFRLCEEIEQNWSTLNEHIQRSQLSASKPRSISGSGRALYPMHTLAKRPYLRARYRMGAKYLLETDIENFYHSIYTHSIPWALHGKSIAKEKRSMDLLGNRLDILMRNGQDGQTIGIPIGPDTSLVLAEVLLSSVDDLITRKLDQLKGFRYMDDYELCFSNLSDAETALNEIESALSHFELDLNPKKTKIKQLPLALEDYWVSELSRFEFRVDSIKKQRSDLISYFSRAFELAKENSESPVLKYAIARLRSIRIDSTNWPLFQDLMLQCVSGEPGTLPYVFDLYVRFSNNGYPVTTNQLEEVLNFQILYHAPLGHGSEVAWSLWGAIAFQVPLHSTTASAVSDMEDSVVALLALDAEQRKLFLASLNKSNWAQYMTREGLYGEQWLLSYEANVKGWIPSVGGDHVMVDPCFSYLKENGVQFYDTSQAARVIPSATSPIPSGPYMG